MVGFLLCLMLSGALIGLAWAANRGYPSVAILRRWRRRAESFQSHLSTRFSWASSIPRVVHDSPTAAGHHVQPAWPLLSDTNPLSPAGIKEVELGQVPSTSSVRPGQPGFRPEGGTGLNTLAASAEPVPPSSCSVTHNVEAGALARPASVGLAPSAPSAPQSTPHGHWQAAQAADPLNISQETAVPAVSQQPTPVLPAEIPLAAGRVVIRPPVAEHVEGDAKEKPGESKPVSMGKYDIGAKRPETETRRMFLGRKDPPVRHLVLHFDVNQTIVLNDTVKNQTVCDVINYLLAEEAWGIEEETESDSRWVAIGAAAECLMVDRPSGSITYLEFLEKKFPGRAGKKKREALAGRFTEVGAAGEVLREVYEKLFALALPPGGEANPSALCVLPAFYRFLVELRKQGRSFSVVFRSFGEDLPNLVADFNAFCEGRKPGFAGVHFDGTEGTPDLRMTPLNTGSWFRAENDFVGVVWGDTDLEKELVAHFKDHTEPPLEGSGSMADFVAKENEKNEGRTLRCTTGLREVSEELRIRTDKPCGMALREYFPLWAKHDRHGSYGKMVMVWRMDETRHDILFDDNIKEEGEHAGIADTVDVGLSRGGHRRLSLPYALRYHLVRANTLAILTEEDWFLKRLKQKEESFTVRYHARRGLRFIYPRLASVLRLYAAARSSDELQTPKEGGCDEALSDGDNPQENGAEVTINIQKEDAMEQVVKLTSSASPCILRKGSNRRSSLGSDYSPWQKDMDLNRKNSRVRPQSRVITEREDMEALLGAALQRREEAAKSKDSAADHRLQQVSEK